MSFVKVACIQSSYIPWKGYFDIINDVDLFVFLDDVQMTKRDWRTRNKIKTQRGTEWLTVPVHGGRNQAIHEVRIVQDDWQRRHLRSLEIHYAKAPYFRDYEWLLTWLYLQPHEKLSDFNQKTTQMICKSLEIETEFISSMELSPEGHKDDRLIDICKKTGANIYLSGPTANDYINAEKFHQAGIALEFKDYAGYPEYAQHYPPFEHYVTVLDLLFHCGSKAARYIWG